MLTLNCINFKYLNQQILQNLSFSLKKGEIGTLIGASGSGKTTIFKLLIGLLSNQEGKIIIDEKDPKMSSSKIACMMQEDLILPWRTVLSNVLLPSELGGKTQSKLRKIEEAKLLLSEMGLEKAENMYPHELSLGMKQRVSLARALLQNLPILLLDEPFASLDVALRETMYTLLREIRSQRNTTMLMVTHDFRDALSLADRIFFLNNGKIEKTWEVSDVTRSDPALAGRLLEEMRNAILNREYHETRDLQVNNKLI